MDSRQSGTESAVILLVVLILGQRFNRSLAPIDEGIEQLARGERVSIKEKGVVKELASNLNQASGILQEQSEAISRGIRPAQSGSPAFPMISVLLCP